MAQSNLTVKNIQVDDSFIQQLSALYIKQRTEAKFDPSSIDQSLLFQRHGFTSHALEKLISKNSIAKDIIRESGGKHNRAMSDIYRSDLGELLMTNFFEQELSVDERFTIPLRNITNRELANLPGRGLDAVGYREVSGKIELLLGEAKVSHQKKNPPDVVDYSKDSIYETQKKFHTNKQALIEKLSDYCRKLSSIDAEKIGLVILLMQFNRTSEYDLLFGCALIRDVSCLKVNEDFGKFFSQQTDFDPHQVNFCILCFDKNIDATIDLFYEKVQEMCNASLS